MKTSLPLVAAAIVLLLVMARAEGIRLDAESHEAFFEEWLAVVTAALECRYEFC